MKKYLIIILFCLQFSSNLFSSTIIGYWSGFISVAGQELNIDVSFFGDDNEIQGLIDIPQQNATGLKLTNISAIADSISFDLKISPVNIAQFRGKVIGDLILGEFTQVAKGSFQLQRTMKAPIIQQEPKVYVSGIEAVFYNDSIKIGGLLTLPEGEVKAAVVLVSGSGQQDRDETVFGFKPFQLLADYLNSNGIAVLRYDDRGVGASGAGDLENATTLDFAGDAQAALDYLKKKINRDVPYGILGHSEGGIIAAMLAAKERNVDFVIFMATPAIPGDSLLFAQGEAILRASGATEEELKIQHGIQEQIFAALRTGEGWDKLHEQWLKIAWEQYNSLSDEGKKAFPDAERTINQAIDAQVKNANTKWMKYFVEHNPASDISKIRCPVLALFGSKDLQVPPSVNYKPMDSLLYNNDIQYNIKIFNDANHLFQKAITGNIGEYSSLEKEFIDGFEQYIVDWLNNYVIK